MRKSTILLGLAGTALLGAIGASAGAQSAASPVAADADGAFGSASKFSETTGEAMYNNVCAGCHMPGGQGAVGAGFYPALARNQKLASGGYPVYVVMKGLNGMPPLGGMMTDQQVADVVNYVRTHFGNRYRDPVSAADVKPLR